MAKKAAEAETKPIKKTDAVKAALAEGVDNPTEAVAFIKAKFDVDITTQQFSTYKSVIKSKGSATTSGKKAARAPRMAKSSDGDHVGNGMIAIADLEAAKALVAKVGSQQAKQLVGLFEL